MNKYFKITLPSHTSDGGNIEFSPGNAGEITIQINSKSHIGEPSEWKDRTDTRVMVSELVEAVEGIKGMYAEYLKQHK